MIPSSLIFTTYIIIMIISAACALLIPPFTAFIIMYRKWKKFGKDPEGRGVIVPQYVPQKI